MKRFRSYEEEIDSSGEKVVCKDWGRRDQDPDHSSSHRRFYSKAEYWRKGFSSSSGYERLIDDDREASRSFRKRLDHDSDGFGRRKSFDRYRDCGDRGISLSSPRYPYGSERVHRYESFSGSRREFQKGFRSERDRSRREVSVSSWRRFSGSKDVDEDVRFAVDSGRGNRVTSEDRGNVRSPQDSRDVLKSPSWSKDSSGEQSKSVEVRKNGEVPEESGCSSEMEEGELEPEAEAEAEAKPEPLHEPELLNEPAALVGVKTEEHMELESEHRIESDVDLEKAEKPSPEEMIELNKEHVSDGKEEDIILETVIDAAKETDELPDCQKSSINYLGVTKGAADIGCGEKEERFQEGRECEPPSNHKPEDPGDEEAVKDASAEKSLPFEEEQREGKGIDLEAEVDDMDSRYLSKEVGEENGTHKVTLSFITDKLTQNGKHKGKSLAVSPSDEANVVEDGGGMERDMLSSREDAMEGPSCRGFELFLSPAATRPEKTHYSDVNKHKAEKLKMESLELSLGLPNISLAVASHDPNPAPCSLSCARSIQSLPTTCCTGSNGFTASISFSGSQQFVHNPSCSLTENSFDNNEHSIGSYPIFQAVDQVSHGTCQGQSSNEPTREGVPLYQRNLLNGNGSLNATQSPPGIVNSQTMHGAKHHKVSKGSCGVPIALDRQSSLSRQLSGVSSSHHDGFWAQTHSVGFQETRSECSKDQKLVKKAKNGGSQFQSSSQREMEQLVIGGTGFVESIIVMIVSKPIQIMARKIHEMTEQSIACLKESACEMIVNEDKHGRLRTFQETLQNRSDLTLETLLKSHRAQLEMLVALQTGLPDFLQPAKDISSSNLAEIFLNLKCRNLACKSMLPVDECECNICIRKSGFCSACMCLVCSKFDMASNTCSWVGCDVCLHWCHTDCGLRKSYIRNGRSVSGAQGTTEMQFHCVACDHPSEMFGFVKEVFKVCAKDWKAETLSKELEYVKRIFSASNDVRGKQLHDIADQMRARLKNKSNLSEVYNHIMGFLTENDSKFENSSTFSRTELPHKNPGEGSKGVVGPSQEATWLTSVARDMAPPAMENAGSFVPSLDWDQMGQRTEDSELQKNAEKKLVVDELESIVRIKHAEAKMFQARADDARREAEGLKHIAITKNKKIEEEYTSRITKLCLAEAEERRRQNLEELQVLERAHCEFFNMKRRMEADIKNLFLKMEVTLQNLSM